MDKKMHLSKILNKKQANQSALCLHDQFILAWLLLCLLHILLFVVCPGSFTRSNLQIYSTSKYNSDQDLCLPGKIWLLDPFIFRVSFIQPKCHLFFNLRRSGLFEVAFSNILHSSSHIVWLNNHFCNVSSSKS